MFEKKQIEKLVLKVKKLEKPYLALMFEKICDIDVKRFDTKEHLRKPPENVDLKDIKPGDRWGGPFETMWLKGKVTIPREAKDRKLVLCSAIDAFECLVFVDNKPKGLFNKDGSVHGGNHSIVFLPENNGQKREYNIDIECYAGTPCLGWEPYDNYGLSNMDDEDYIRTYKGVSLCAIDESVADFVFNLKTLNQIYLISEDNSAQKGKALTCMMNMYKEVNQYPADTDDEIWREQMKKANSVISAFLQEQPTGYGEVGLIGHAHLDTAWLWTVEETKRKSARTLSNALSLMEQYDEYTFIQSSSLHSAWMKELYPDVFSDMKKRIAEGRYEPNGAVWVECDCNITGGEAMIRQFLWGQRFTKKEFGYTSDAFWLPDTFGYSAAIPQIMKGCNVRYFLTTKMEWNESNKFPHDSFVWQGQDGTEVLVHLNRMDCWPDVKEVSSNFNGLSDKHASDMKLISYGYGDGGGGPQYQMLEMAKRANAANNPVSSHTTVSRFMHKLDKKRENLPKWVGELYLELHRGTLTSIHDIKRSNRLLEIALREYELISVLQHNSGFEKTDKEKINALWEILLKNQFHDILPGTCIPEVYDIAVCENYEAIEKAKEETIKLISSVSEKTESVTVFNSLGWDRKAYVTLDSGKFIKGVHGQDTINIKGEKQRVFKVDVPAMGSTVCELFSENIVGETMFDFDGMKLETPLYTAVFDKNRAIKSLIDKNTGRQIARCDNKPLNTFSMVQDVPLSWDNWDIDPDIKLKEKEEVELISSKVVSIGKYEFRMENLYNIGQGSSIKQHIVFYSDNMRIDFETHVDWHEKHKLLKTSFDVDILSSTVKNEMQFGHVDRTTHSNTSWDAAKTDVCNHKWSDISDAHYGVSLLNDCKYGMACEGSEMTLTLMKSGTHPDPRGDEGMHEFTYSLLPHKGVFCAESVVYPAYELNYKPILVQGSYDIESFVVADRPNIIIESVKPSEDEDGYILRLYECEKAKTIGVKLGFCYTPSKAFETNMLEEKIKQLGIEDRFITLDFEPFEIKSIFIEYKKEAVVQSS